MDLKELFSIDNKKTIKEEFKTRLSTTSVDSQIDSLLLNYQNAASIEPEANENYMPHYFKTLLGEKNDWVIIEAGEETPEDDASDQEDMSMGDEQIKSNTPERPRDQKINIDEYAEKIANLCSSYDNVLNIKDVIISRAANILSQGYLPDIANQFMDILDREFDLRIGQEQEENDLVSPLGGSAGPIE